MIKRIFFILNVLIFSYFNSQLKMELNIDYTGKKASMTLINTSKDNLIIPIDTISLHPYFNDVCLELAHHNYTFPTLGLNIKIEEDNKIVESSAGSGRIDNLSELKKIDLEKKGYERKIKLWQKKNGIKSFDNAKINYYIFNNLNYLKPGEKIEKEFYFDLHNITNGKYMYYYYHIEDNKQYDVSLSFNIEDCVYKYLTASQKQRFSDYQLFIGSIESNKIQLKK